MWPFTEQVRILFVSTGGDSDSITGGSLKTEYGPEFRSIARALKGGKLRERFVAPLYCPARTRADIVRAIDEHRPNILHLSAHGLCEPLTGEVVMKLPDGEIDAEFFEGIAKISPGTRLFYLNGCWSDGLLRTLAATGIAAVGAKGMLDEDMAHAMVEPIYGALADGQTIRQAFDKAQLSVPACAGIVHYAGAVDDPIVLRHSIWAPLGASVLLLALAVGASTLWRSDPNTEGSTMETSEPTTPVGGAPEPTTGGSTTANLPGPTVLPTTEPSEGALMSTTTAKRVGEDSTSAGTPSSLGVATRPGSSSPVLNPTPKPSTQDPLPREEPCPTVQDYHDIILEQIHDKSCSEVDPTGAVDFALRFSASGWVMSARDTCTEGTLCRCVRSSALRGLVAPSGHCPLPKGLRGSFNARSNELSLHLP